MSVRGFLKEAERILKEAKNKTRKYEINYFDKNEMKKYATKYQAKKFLEHIHKHFNYILIKCLRGWIILIKIRSGGDESKQKIFNFFWITASY